MTPGDWVMISVDDGEMLVEVGALHGVHITRSGKRRGEVHTVLVNRMDARTFTKIPYGERCAFSAGLVSPDVEVIEVVARIEFLRGLRYRRARTAGQIAAAEDLGGEVDPMQTMHDRAERLALLE